MSRNAAEWLQHPKLPQSHFVDSRIYSDDAIFREEQQSVFNKSWIIACHESELPGAFDYRTFHHPGGTPLIVVRGEDTQIRSFYNVCPHRGNTLLYDPVGNAKRITCIFHSWSFDTRGNCIDISRGDKPFFYFEVRGKHQILRRKPEGSPADLRVEVKPSVFVRKRIALDVRAGLAGGVVVDELLPARTPVGGFAEGRHAS